MTIVELIEDKKKKKKLSKKQIDFFINGLMDNTIPDYQISALLMAIWFNGLDDNELFFLTSAMVNSGNTYNFHSNYRKVLIDKHSTGGVGDKVSIVLVPMLACFGVGVCKISGRGLGFTGGTIDKLESIGMNTNVSIDQAKSFLEKNDMFIISQTKDIVPADKILYALRDVTGTVDSMPLIAASVLSKKIALESDYIFIDIKYGEGAFCKNFIGARKLSAIINKLAKKFKRKVYSVLSDTNNVIGRSIGNAVEVREAVSYLKGDEVEENFKSLVDSLIVLIALKTKICKSESEVREKIKKIIDEKLAFQRFCDWVEMQGGNVGKIRNDTFFHPKYQFILRANKSGILTYKSVLDLADLSVDLGSGRKTKTDVIDYQAGIYLHTTNRSCVKKNGKVMTLYSSNSIVPDLIERAKKIFKIN